MLLQFFYIYCTFKKLCYCIIKYNNQSCSDVQIQTLQHQFIRGKEACLLFNFLNRHRCGEKTVDQLFDFFLTDDIFAMSI